MDEITRALQSNDLYLYTTYVHALKSASANVGAMKMSEFAKSLELAGKNEDVMFITENNDEFFESIRALLENIKPVLAKATEDNEAAAGEVDLGKLKDDLAKLRDALDQMDIGTVDSIVTQLQAQKFTGNVRDMVEGIFHCILMFEYDDATAKIDELLSS
jgi:HPt (histidine-containing phosphotransfer) domain-containing protein